MSPEYAMDGIFSVKSDVFSFGVLVLEIITAKKNRGVYLTKPDVNLLGHVSICIFYCTHEILHGAMLKLSVLTNYDMIKIFRHGVYGEKGRPWN